MSAVEVMCHRFDEPRLPTPGRTLQDDRQTLPIRRLEHLILVADREVEGAIAGLHDASLSIWWRSLERSVR